MVIILEATAGPIAGRRIEVRPGAILRIGRTAKSDLPIAEDSYLSSLHFSVEYDGARCRVRDLGSSNGTFVNGSRVTEWIVSEGDSLVAGSSTFAVHVDASAGPRIAETVQMNLAQLQSGFTRAQSALIGALYRERGNLFAVLDASRDSRIPAFLDASGERYTVIALTAYAVAVPQGSRLLDVLIKDGWGRGWGFYCDTAAGLEELCEHWRAYAVLHTSDGRDVTFRFWDPRVLRALTPPMPDAEAAAFFGPIRRMIVESDKPEFALELTPSPRGRMQNLPLI
ncbi:MAG TPA: DUF4123 domain-containing protein [Bryobacteraceae bacterium]|jgi:hypothetical protein